MEAERCRGAPARARRVGALTQEHALTECFLHEGADRRLLLYDTKAGHSGGKPVTKQITNLTDEVSFLFAQLGVRYEGSKP